jgi:putative ABC transport system substrate-binding protein
MKRRNLITLLGGAAVAWPFAAHAQQKAMPLVAYFSIGSAAGRERFSDAFRKGLADSGYIEGKNLALEFDWAGDDYSRLPRLAADLVGRRVDVIAAGQLPVAVAAKSATKTIPIVFVIGDDPIKHGLAASFNHPGGNSTGVSMLNVGLVAKRLELLHELVPGVVLVAVLVNPKNQNVATQRAELQEASRAMRQRIEVFDASTAAEIDAAFAALDRAGAKALAVGADPVFNDRRAQIVALAARYAIPGIYEWREYSDQGGLASYGPSLAEQYHQLGLYAGRVLKGENPADLPVQQPTRFELVVNLKTATALGLTVPTSILARADEVIE